jgi:hypothetical protein
MNTAMGAIRSNIWVARATGFVHDHEGAWWHRAEAGRLLVNDGMQEKARRQYALAVKHLLRIADSAREDDTEYAMGALDKARTYLGIVDEIGSKLKRQTAKKILSIVD